VGAELFITRPKRVPVRWQGTESDDAAPQDPTGAVPSEHAAGEAAAEANITIMLVEDEPMVRALLARVLRGRGYWVIEATNGVEALDVAARLTQPVDLLITDVIMPRLGGADLAAQMLAVGHTTRVLYMTGYSDVALHGVDLSTAVLRKPFAPRALIEAVLRMLDT
jgi:CheY-like chemotaxis protein